MASDQTPQLMVDLLRLLAKHWWQLPTQAIVGPREGLSWL